MCAEPNQIYPMAHGTICKYGHFHKMDRFWTDYLVLSTERGLSNGGNHILIGGGVHKIWGLENVYLKVRINV